MQKLLCQLIALNGFATNADIPGCEKLVVTGLQRAWLSSSPLLLSAADVSSATIAVNPLLLSPQMCYMVKGWNRASCCLLVLLAAMEMAPFLEALR